MTLASPRSLSALLVLLAVSGCAAATPDPRFPSLLPRAIETRGDAEPVAVPVVATADPATDARIASLRAEFAKTSASFATAAAAAERKASSAKGDAVGGERWIAAQTALGELDTLRAAASSTQTDVEELALDRAAAGLPPYPALEALRGEVQAAGEAQSARIGTIQSRLPPA